MRVCVLFAALTFAVLLAGCASAPGNFKPVSSKPGHATIYVYLPPSMLLNQVKSYSTLSIDGKQIGNAGAGLHYVSHVKPGKHTVAYGDPLNWGSLLIGGNKISLQVAAGQSYFIRVSPDIDSVKTGMLSPRVVPSHVGKAEIKQTQRGN